MNMTLGIILLRLELLGTKIEKLEVQHEKKDNCWMRNEAFSSTTRDANVVTRMLEKQERNIEYLTKKQAELNEELKGHVKNLLKRQESNLDLVERGLKMRFDGIDFDLRFVLVIVLLLLCLENSSRTV